MTNSETRLADPHLPVLFSGVLRPAKIEHLCLALLQEPWLIHLHACEVRVPREGDVHSSWGLEFLPRVSIEGCIDGDAVDPFLALVNTYCRTGRDGDGKIFLRSADHRLDV